MTIPGNCRITLGLTGNPSNVVAVMKLFFGLILASSLLAFDASTDTWMSVTTKKGVPISQEPGTNQTEVGFVPFKGVVTVLAADGPQATLHGVTAKWYKVKYQGKIGWMFSGFLQPVEAMTKRASDTETKQNQLASVPETDGSFFIMPNGNNIRYYSTQFSKYVTIKRNYDKYPLYINGRTDAFDGQPIQISDAESEFLKAGHTYLHYIRAHYGPNYIAANDISFVKVNKDNKAKYSFIGSFTCKPAKTSIACKLCDSDDVNPEDCFVNQAPNKQVRTFKITKATVFFGHFFLASEDGNTDMCGLAPYRESRQIPQVSREQEILEWNIFSKDGRTADAVNLRHWRHCQ
jgi:hypothetical protein